MSFIDDVKKRLSAATPGPWTNDPKNDGPYNRVCEVSSGGNVSANKDFRIDADGDCFNADFIAHAPTDIAKMLKLVELYETALEKIEDPRKRDHREPDKYTECACIMNIADGALTEGAKIKERT